MNDEPLLLEVQDASVVEGVKLAPASVLVARDAEAEDGLVEVDVVLRRRISVAALAALLVAGTVTPQNVDLSAALRRLGRGTSVSSRPASPIPVPGQAEA
jgi:hypothetical protein